MIFVDIRSPKILGRPKEDQSYSHLRWNEDGSFVHLRGLVVRQTILDWLEQNCQSGWYVVINRQLENIDDWLMDSRTWIAWVEKDPKAREKYRNTYEIAFREASDALLFKLTWGGQ